MRRAGRWLAIVELRQATQQRELVGGRGVPAERKIQLDEAQVQLGIGRRERRARR